MSSCQSRICPTGEQSANGKLQVLVILLVWITWGVKAEIPLEFPNLEKAISEISRESELHRYEVICDDALLYLGPMDSNGLQIREYCPLVFTLERSSKGWTVINLGSSFEPLDIRLQIKDLRVESQKEGKDQWNLTIAWEMAREVKNEELVRPRKEAGLGLVSTWDIGGRHRTQLTTHRLHITIDKKSEGISLELNLKEAVGQEQSPTMPPPSAKDQTKISLKELEQYFTGSSKQDLHLKLIWREGAFYLNHVTSPGWNRGLHRVTKSDLKQGSDGIEGKFVVSFQADPWVPLDRQSKKMTYKISLDKKKGWQGQFEGKGSWPPREGAIETKGGAVLKGRYRLEGVDGIENGELQALGGKVYLESRQDARTQLLEMLGEVLDKDAPIIKTKIPENSHGKFRDTLEGQALKLLEEGWRTEAPAQEFQPGLMEVQLATSLENKTVPNLEEENFRWFRLGDWEAIGPFHQEKALGPVSPLLPELIHGGDNSASFKDTQDKFGKRVLVPRKWMRAHESNGWTFLPLEQEKSLWLSEQKLEGHLEHPLSSAYRSLEMRDRSLVWYASTSIKVEKTKVYWFTVGGREKLGLYLDGQRIFTTRSSQSGEGLFKFPLQLEKGEHRLLVRVGIDDLDYHPEKDYRPSGFRLLIGNGYLSESLKVRKPPSVEAKGVGSPFFAHGSGRSWFHLLDSKEASLNWSETVRPGRTQPVLVEDRLIFTSWGGWVEARGMKRGKLLWEKRLGGRSRPSTPAVLEDGVVVHFAPGFLARLSLDGQVLWEVPTGEPNGQGSPPLVVDDMVFVQILNEKISMGASEKRYFQERLQARSLKNGELLWEHTHENPLRGMALVLPPGGGPLLVTATGDVFEVASGKKLPWNLMDGFEDPIGGRDLLARGNEVHFVSSSTRTGYRFSMGASKLEVEQLYSEPGLGASGGEPLLMHEELWIPHKNKASDVILNVVNRIDGQLLAQLGPFPTIKDGSMELFGMADRLLAFHTGGREKADSRGGVEVKLSLIKGGASPQILSRKSFGKKTELVAGPELGKGAMFLRFENRLHSFQVDRIEKISQQRQWAEMLLSDLGDPPLQEEIVVPPQLNSGMGSVHDLRDGPSPFSWWKSGPHPMEEEDPGSWANFLDGKGWHGPGDLVPMEEAKVRATSYIEIVREGRKLYVPRNQLNLSSVVGQRTHTRTFFVSLLRVTEAGTFRLKVPSRNTEIAISGVHLKSGNLIKFKPGLYSMLVKVEVGRLPVFGRSSLDVQLLEENNPNLVYERWQKKADEKKQDLEKIIGEPSLKEFHDQAIDLLKEIKSRP